jgi:multiple sugar transport system permease protein
VAGLARAASPPTARRRRISRGTLRNTAYGLLFAAPWLIGFCLFYAYPILASLLYSFHDYNGLQVANFVGFENYMWALRGDDPQFPAAVFNTIYYTFIAVPAAVAFALTIALMLNLKIHGQFVYRTIYFIPVLVPEVALSIVWLQMFNPQYGLVNSAIEGLGAMLGQSWTGPGWLTSQEWSKPTMVIMNMWLVGQAVVIYLAGLQDVPQDMYDAASVDGANAWHKIRYVTLPMITPVIFFNLVISMIAATQFFTQPYVLTGGLGTPANSLMFYVMMLYRQAFVFFRLGLASALAWMLFLAILVVTFIIFKTSNRWVYYGGEGK